MEQPIQLNARFRTFAALHQAKLIQQNLDECVWTISRSKYININDPNITGSEPHKDNKIKDLVYSYIRYNCECGVPAKSTAKMRNTTTKKVGCKSFILCNVVNNSLQIKDLNLDHDLLCTGSYKKQTLPREILKMAIFLNSNKTPTKSIANYLSIQSKEYYSVKDVHNLFYRQTQSFSVDEALGIIKARGNVWEIKNTSQKTMGVAYQTETMKDNYKKYGEVGILDSTFKLTDLNWTFFMLVGVDENLKTVPFFSFVIHNESYNMLKNAFKIFASYNDVSKTSYVITDKDLSERKILRQIFSDATLNICRFHIIKTFDNRINRLVGVGKDIKDVNRTIIKQLCYLQNKSIYYELVSKFHPSIKAYFMKNWSNIKDEFIPCFKTGSLYFDINTTNNVESYFNTVKSELPLRQSLGNFLISISNFFEYKHIANHEGKKRRGKRVPNRKIHPLIRGLKGKISNFAFDTLLEIESSSYYLSSSNENHIFDLDRCCTFQEKFGLPCSHVFYNLRYYNNYNIIDFIINRWKTGTKNNDKNTKDSLSEMKYDYDETKNSVNENLNSSSTETKITQIKKAKLFVIETVNNSNQSSKIQLYKHYKIFCKKIASILSDKNISKESGTKILEEIIFCLETNCPDRLLKKLNPDDLIIKHNISKEKSIIRKLLDSNTEVNKNQKGRKRIKRNRAINK